MNRILLALMCIVAVTSDALGQSQPAQTKPAFTMKQYQMVFLKVGPKRDQDSATAAAIQRGHMSNIQRLDSLGKLVLAGPFGDKGDLRGIFIMDVKDREEAAKLCDTDPAVVAGRLIYEIKPWWGPAGLTYEGAPKK